MYHVLQNVNRNAYLLVETPSYMSSNEEHSVPKSLDGSHHFGKHHNAGRPIEEALTGNTIWKLLFSVKKIEEMETNYPEYFI